MSSDPTPAARTSRALSTVSAEPAPVPTAEVIAAAVLATPGVHDLHPGAVGQVATYLPGHRVNGIRATGDGYDVHIVLSWGCPVSATAEAVRVAVQAIAPGQVDVTIEDVAPAATSRP